MHKILYRISRPPMWRIVFVARMDRRVNKTETYVRSQIQMSSKQRFNR